MASNRTKKNGWMKWVVCIAVIAVVAIGAYSLGGNRADATANTGAVTASTTNTNTGTATGNYAAVTRGTLTATVYGEGSLAPSKKQTLYTEVEGKVTSVDVEAGDTVQAGDVLMRLSSDDLESQVTDLFSKQVSLAAVRDKGSDTYIYAPCAGRLKIVEVEKDDDVAVAMKTKGQLAVISRDDKLKIEFESSSSTESLKVGDTITVWIDSKSVQGYVEQLSGLGGKIAVTVEDDEYDLGKEVLVSTLQGEKLGTGKLQINMPVPVTGIGGVINKVYYEEEDSVESGAKLFYLDGRIPSSDLQQALLNYNNSKTDLDNALDKQENLVVRAPISGVITVVNASEGQQLEESTAAFQIQSSSEFKLNADVDELDIVNVTEGQRATVTLDAYSGKTFQGTVQKVSGVAKVSGGVATYEVTVVMDQSIELKDGMTASMEIISSEKQGVLMVPSSAINSANGQVYVTTSAGRTVYVETGISNEDYVEIVSGLSEGEMVLLRERTESSGMMNPASMMGGETIRALDHVNMKIDEKEFVAIIGPSGSGKSTLMNIVGCLDYPDEGHYVLDGEDVSKLSERELAIVRNEKIGFIFQQFNLLPKLSAYENVELPLIYQNVGLSERKERTNEALERVGLSGRMQHKPSELSGGQQQRVAIARALATKPSLILADEPTGNLDSKSGYEIMGMLHELHEQGNTIVLITHDNHVANEAQRRIAIHDGILTQLEGEAISA